MLIRRKTRSGIENSSALSDMAFLLIIYFIVIAGFNVNQGFLMNLPKKDSVRAVPYGELLRFSINRDGSLSFLGNVLTYKEASAEIRSALAQRPNTAVVLDVDQNAPWQSVVAFVELAQENAVESFSFSMRKPEGASP
ncbi:MAG: biopolymer transporter ExbD [Spirochaetaceae bacterium]|jgi:biopolymer transport protein ExbD|nr:biopolymer transporter ExbD [Spirochaetaceae bacterium]